jgi:hypothetical protein
LLYKEVIYTNLVLDPFECMAILLSYMEDMPIKKISVIMKIPVGTISRICIEAEKIGCLFKKRRI